MNVKVQAQMRHNALYRNVLLKFETSEIKPRRYDAVSHGKIQYNKKNDGQ